MDATTMVTTVTGQQYVVRGEFEEIDALLTARRLSADDGKRRLVCADGRRVTVKIGVVATIEEARAARRQRIGFR